MPKTQKDLLLSCFEKLSKDPVQGKLLRVKFEQEILPNFKKNKEWDKEIPDEEFEEKLAQMEKELPYYLHYLQNNKFPKPPSNHVNKN